MLKFSLEISVFSKFTLRFLKFFSYKLHKVTLMITRPALCPAGSTFWNKTPKSQLPINQISSSFFAPHLLASLKATECSTGPSAGPIYQD